MKTADLINYRLINQQIAETKFKKPDEIVGWLAAMQAQDFAMAKWAIGLRLPGLNDADVENAFNDGTILRTHVMRPTWHFVTPADIRWMLTLTASRVNAINAYYYRKFELDNKVFKRSTDTLAKALQGGKQLTRTTLKSALDRAKINADGLRLGYIMMRAELDGIICSGARQGKQFTYALLDERVPPAKILNREEALAELSNRYFTSRGPATLQDFVWWSGLTMKEAKEGIASLKPHFLQQVIDGRNYIFAPGVLENNPTRAIQKTFLMPDYDEYGISYKNRSALSQLPPKKNIPPESKDESTYYHMIVIDGLIAGNWRRKIRNHTIIVETTLFNKLNNTKQQAVIKAAKRYSSFLGKVFEGGNPEEK